jgi:hypothetical protein
MTHFCIKTVYLPQAKMTDFTAKSGFFSILYLKKVFLKKPEFLEFF